MSNTPGDNPSLPKNQKSLPGRGVRRDLKDAWGSIRSKVADNLENANPEARLVALERLKPNPDQPRRTFDVDRDLELARDIKERGILEPLLVRKIAEDEQGPLYQIIAGERRFRAALTAELTRVPVIVKDYDDREARLVSLVENLQRMDLDPLDEAHFFQMLIQEYNFSYRQIAAMINRSAAYVSDKLKRLGEGQSQEESFPGSQKNMVEEALISEKSNKRSDSEQKLQNSQSRANPVINPVHRFKEFVGRTRTKLKNINPQDREMLVTEIRDLQEQLRLLEEEVMKVSRET